MDMDTGVDKALTQMLTGKVAGDALVLMTELLQALEHEVDRRVISQAEAGTLTPEAALLGWYEKTSYHKLRKRLQSKQRVGIQAAERLAPHMNLTEGH